MSPDVSGFDKVVTGGAVTIAVADNHRLVKLAQKLPWDEMLKLAIRGSLREGTEFPGACQQPFTSLGCSQ